MYSYYWKVMVKPYVETWRLLFPRCPQYPGIDILGSYAAHDEISRNGPTPIDPTLQPVFTAGQIADPELTIYVIERGTNNNSWNYTTFTAGEWDWTATVYGKDGLILHRSELSLVNGDCDSNDGAYAGCGMKPRYRHPTPYSYQGLPSMATHTAMVDGHVRTFFRNANRSSISWYRNVFVPEANYYTSLGYPW